MAVWESRTKILNVHDLNTSLNYLSSNVLLLYCIFDVQNLVLCLNRELIKIIDYKIRLKLRCKNYSDRILLARLCSYKPGDKS
jgi:hypothetical protein